MSNSDKNEHYSLNFIHLLAESHSLVPHKGQNEAKSPKKGQNGLFSLILSDFD